MGTRYAPERDWAHQVHHEPGKPGTAPAWDLTVGCGQPEPPAGRPLTEDGPGEVVTGRWCAKLGKQPSCQLCPDSPTYWRVTIDPSTGPGVA